MKTSVDNTQDGKIQQSELFVLYDDVRQQQGNNAKAYILYKFHEIARHTLCEQNPGFCSNAGITRAKKALEAGFDACISGRHKKLNEADEMILESWILELIEQGETVYPTRVIHLVLFFFCLFIFF